MLAGLGAGGAERVVSLIAAALVRGGNEVTVVSFDRPADPVFHAFPAGVPLVRLGLPPGSAPGPLLVVRRAAALRGTLGELRPDVVVSFLTKINVVALLASLGRRHRLIVSERNNPRAQPANRGWGMMLRALLPRADAIVMQTRASLSLLDARARRRARVIANPMAVPLRERRPGQTIVGVGRLDRQKGFDLLIDAFARLAPAHSDWKLVIWGEGPERAALEAHVASLGLGQRATLPGNSAAPGGWLDQAEVFALSSRYEGMPNVLGEAMAAGVPAAAFACAFGPDEMIAHGETGLLAPAGDVAALAAALETLVADAALRERIGAAAKAASARYAPAAITAEWRALINSLLGARASVGESQPERRGPAAEPLDRLVGIAPGEAAVAQHG
ncbi:glycosyltransferase [Sphingomonas sp. BK069]|uniref:glycosyltransferase n=1 Tax=Sphingomonas sp. BK069 TaxID=2586979 RepID=UPI001801FBFF|nr:glycosyltransferase [Sphingomonas sp. BK069]MBB3346794.1 glycosyltransferase involved in cell wall biosynthesis [Sphingomonas sp. BK069]